MKRGHLGKILEKVKTVRITTAKGTDFTVAVSKKRVLADDTGIYSKPKGFGNLPAGEVCFAPLEGKSNGVFVVDASMFEELKKLREQNDRLNQKIEELSRSPPSQGVSPISLSQLHEAIAKTQELRGDTKDTLDKTIDFILKYAKVTNFV